jgi:hypothetical protein
LREIDFFYPPRGGIRQRKIILVLVGQEGHEKQLKIDTRWSLLETAVSHSLARVRGTGKFVLVVCETTLLHDELPSSFFPFIYFSLKHCLTVSFFCGERYNDERRAVLVEEV